VALNCRGGSPAEAAAYAASLSLWQGRIAAQVDRFLVPSAFALRRLRQLGAPVDDRAAVLASVQREFADGSRAAAGRHVLYAGRLSHEKGVADAVAACRQAGLPLVVAGDGPAEAELRQLAAGGDVRFTGRVGPERLAELRREAAVAVVPSRYAEILPLAALEAMAAGLPVVAARSGGLAELVPSEGLFPPGDVDALAARTRRLWGDATAGERALARVRERSAPAAVARALTAAYR
jgi:glycosyltransferase involved in cell wall biosynthesis